MNKQTKALKMVIEFMDLIEQYASNDELCVDNDKLNLLMSNAQQACKEALEQPAQSQSYEYTEGYQQGYVEGWEAKKAEQPAQEPLYFALTKDHTWISITEQQYDKLNPDYRMKVCTYENT